ncbi:unnamed protein product [Arctogadus glacialis]
MQTASVGRDDVRSGRDTALDERGGDSGSVRSCLLIPALTASLRVRETHSKALPPEPREPSDCPPSLLPYLRRLLRFSSPMTR